MAAIGTLNSICSGHQAFVPRLPAESESLLKVNGIPVLVEGKLYKPHSDGKSTHTGQCVSTRPWFTINGKAVVCVGDPVSCGSTVAIGDGLVNIG